MNSANVWHFYHISRKKKYGPFSFEQLCSIFSKNNIQEDQILIFKNGFIYYFKKNQPEMHSSIEEELPKQTVESSLEISMPSIKAELNVIIILGKKTFKTKTMCIGDKALQLKHNLPSHFLQENVNVYLKAPDNRSTIKLSAKIIKTEAELILFQIENEISQKTFDRWLNYFTEKSESMIQTKKIA